MKFLVSSFNILLFLPDSDFALHADFYKLSSMTRSNDILILRCEMTMLLVVEI